MHKPLLIIFKIDHLGLCILSSSLILLNTSSIFYLGTSIRVKDSGLYLFYFLFTFLFLDLELEVSMTVTNYHTEGYRKFWNNDVTPHVSSM